MRHNGTGNALLDAVVNDPTMDVREACGLVNSTAGFFAPVTALLTRLFVGNRLSDYPQVFRPADADPFNWAASIFLPAAPSAETVVLSFKVPTGYNGVILHVVNLITQGFLEGSGAIVWALKEGVKPIKNFGRIITTEGSLVTPWPVYGIRIHADQTIQFTITNNSVPGVNIEAICVVGGYYWPQGRKR
jgi:hypothetical protein